MKKIIYLTTLCLSIVMVVGLTSCKIGKNTDAFAVQGAPNTGPSPIEPE